MTSATHHPIDLRGVAIFVSVVILAPGAMAQRSGAAIVTQQDASAYVMGVLSEAGCRMRFAAFEAQLATDGLAEPSGEADDPATLVAAAPLKLLNEGLISEDPGDPQILVSNGAGCD